MFYTINEEQNQDIPEKVPLIRKYKLQHNQRVKNNKVKSVKWTKKDLVYEKLSQNNRPYYVEIARLIQEMEERKQCTFKPQVNQEGRRYDDQQDLFERLYQEKQLKDMDHQRRQHIKMVKETLGCTFTPNRITKPQNSRQLFEKLYKDHEYLQKSRQFKKLIMEQQEQQGLTFTPQLLTRSRDNSNSKLTQKDQRKRFEDLYQDSSKREEKINKLKQDQNHLIDSQQKMKFRARSNSFSSKSIKDNDERSLPRYVCLYEKSLQKKDKMRKLEKDVDKERGITFTPTKYSAQSVRNTSQSKLINQNEPTKILNMKNMSSKQSKAKLPPKPINMSRK
ncbi:UNKNOWN [Stylonychia lemnae]|uniref:Uncharacterized protein n=1 Tax=Stylonychia lemnae TaxID=5949 RepID=A0A078AC93_STYLE|nr:UNKNOWN [Stylonychia lemnae]|eukprot:CDW78423.1 UNKNOWN [Stylonychia lemnae]